MIPTIHRRLVAALLAGVGCFAPLAASQAQAQAQAQAQQAQAWPARPVRMIVGYPPGGSNDILARLVAEGLGEQFKQTFVVDNRPGANSIIAAEAATRAPADGYTLLVAASSTMTINPIIYKTLSYDPASLVPVTLLGSFPVALVVNAKEPYRSVGDLIKASNTSGNDITYSSASLAFQLGAEQLGKMSGGHFRNVPYKGSAQALAGVLSGDVRFTMLDMAPLVPHLKNGTLRALGVSTATRFRGHESIPTIAESGVPGYDFKLWIGLFAPKGTPPDVTDKLYKAVSAYVQRADIRDKLGALGIEAGGDAPRDVSQMIAAESTRFAEIVKDAGIKAEP